MPLQEILCGAVAHSGRDDVSFTVPAETALNALLASPGRIRIPLLVASRPVPAVLTGAHGREVVPSSRIRTVSPVVRQNVPLASVAARVSFAVQADRLLLGVGDGDGDTLPLPVSDFVPPQPVRVS